MTKISDIKYDGKKGVPIIRDVGNATRVHTGLWGKTKPVTDYSKCIGCRTCYIYCPVGAITWDEKKNKPKTNYFTCKSCGICPDVCPVKCIKMIEI